MKSGSGKKLEARERARERERERWSGKTKHVKRIGTRPSALHSTIHLERTSRRIATFCMVLGAKIKEASQNSFILNGVKCKNSVEASQNSFVFKLCR